MSGNVGISVRSRTSPSGAAPLEAVSVPFVRVGTVMTATALLLCSLLSTPSLAQGEASADARAAFLSGADGDATNEPGTPTHELHPARLVYAHGAQASWGPGRAWWRIDWPEAEQHFLAGVARYTAIDVASDSAHVSLLDDALFEHPWLFAQQPGRWGLSDAETTRLGEYLVRGGFLVVDDFHGPADWAVFEEAMRRALPGRPIEDLDDDELLNVLYTLDARTQIPGRRHLVGGAGGIEARMPYAPPRWRGIRDEAGRLVVAINFNMDMGDAWEHADDPYYPVPMTSFAYRVGINYLVYAMTH